MDDVQRLFHSMLGLRGSIATLMEGLELDGMDVNILRMIQGVKVATKWEYRCLGMKSRGN